jgi:hypothetical protein
MGGACKRGWRQVAFGCGVAGLAGLAFCWGRSSAQTPVMAGSPGPAGTVIHKPLEMMDSAPVACDRGSDYHNRVVAYIHKNVPITREDLGEYLIARFGPDKVEALVNRKIVDHACESRGIHITDGEVEAAFQEDLRGLGNLSAKDFEEKLLKPRNTTLYQWKEDVIRPKLALTQFCRERVSVTDEDIKNAFENRFGEKVDCRMIVLTRDPSQTTNNFKIWAKVRQSAEEFDRQARQQPIAALAARNGAVPPVGHHCGDKQIEEAAFGLRPGEVSGLIEKPEGTVIIKCVGRLPAQKKEMSPEDRVALRKEVMDQKVLDEIPKVLKDLRTKADPQYFIKKTAEQFYSEVAKEAGLPQSVVTPPAGK